MRPQLRYLTFYFFRKGWHLKKAERGGGYDGGRWRDLRKWLLRYVAAEAFFGLVG
jgi:hypothetical protein